MAAAKASLQGAEKVKMLHAPIWLKFQEIKPVKYSVLYESVVSYPVENWEGENAPKQRSIYKFNTEFWLVIEGV